MATDVAGAGGRSVCWYRVVMPSRPRAAKEASEVHCNASGDRSTLKSAASLSEWVVQSSRTLRLPPFLKVRYRGRGRGWEKITAVGFVASSDTDYVISYEKS